VDFSAMTASAGLVPDLGYVAKPSDQRVVTSEDPKRWERKNEFRNDKPAAELDGDGSPVGDPVPSFQHF
jgi:hypothetical protein